jgi:hypothetical protein
MSSATWALPQRNSVRAPPGSTIVMPVPNGATSWATDSTTLDTNIRSVVHRVPGNATCPPGDLNDAAATLATEVREGRADELDRSHQLGRDRVVDLRVVSRGSGSHRMNRAKSWTFQRSGALHQTLPLGAILVVSSFGA